MNSEEGFRKKCKKEIHWITAVNIQVETFKECEDFQSWKLKGSEKALKVKNIRGY